jgi:TPR repeat protein
MNSELSELVTKAEAGSAEAQYALGSLLSRGEECARDSGAAFKWLMLAAEQDHAKAQEMVGNCFHSGFGVARDYEEAFKWYQKSSNQGNSSALCELGFCYQKGRGTSVNPVEALGCFKRAAGLANVDALHHVVMYYVKEAKDYTEATRWLDRIRDFFPHYTSGEFEVDGANWYFSILGDIFFDGVGEPDASGGVIKKDYNKAYWIYRIGANAKDRMSILKLLFLNGIPGNEYLVPHKEASIFAMRGASLGCSYSARFLGDAYSVGRGVPKSAVEAVNWWTKAAYQGDYQAQYNLGVAYQDGLGVSRDPIEAYVWINLSAACSLPHVSRCMEARDLLEVSLTPDQLAFAQKRSIEIHATLKKA